MRAPTHACFGLLCGSLVSSFYAPSLEEKLGLNVLSAAALISVILGAFLPDIDTPHSPASRYIPLSSWIHRRWPHRTLVHSFCGLVVATALTYGSLRFAEALRFQILGIHWPRSHLVFLSALFAVGFFSHLTLDTCTRQGVRWFLPFIPNAFGYPSIEQYRLITGDKRAELTISALSLGLFIWFLPIARQGADASLNNAIGDFAHLRSYYQSAVNKEVLLHYEGYFSTDKSHVDGTGIILEATSNSFIVFDGKEVLSVGKSSVDVQLIKGRCSTLDISPQVSTQTFFETSLADIIADTQPHVLLSGHLYANQAIEADKPLDERAVKVTSKSLKMSFAQVHELLALHVRKKEDITKQHLEQQLPDIQHQLDSLLGVHNQSSDHLFRHTLQQEVEGQRKRLGKIENQIADIELGSGDLLFSGTMSFRLIPSF